MKWTRQLWDLALTSRLLFYDPVHVLGAIQGQRQVTGVLGIGPLVLLSVSFAILFGGLGDVSRLFLAPKLDPVVWNHLEKLPGFNNIVSFILSFITVSSVIAINTALAVLPAYFVLTTIKGNTISLSLQNCFDYVIYVTLIILSWSTFLFWCISWILEVDNLFGWTPNPKDMVSAYIVGLVFGLQLVVREIESLTSVSTIPLSFAFISPFIASAALFVRLTGGRLIFSCGLVTCFYVIVVAPFLLMMYFTSGRRILNWVLEGIILFLGLALIALLPVTIIARVLWWRQIGIGWVLRTAWRVIDKQSYRSSDK